MGLRNPFTFAFQPGTGRMFINDVGQSTWEEIDDGEAGANYGWRAARAVPTDPAGFKQPFYAYIRTAAQPTGCAITGGTFYNPTRRSFPRSYVGDYFFADLCGGWIYKIETIGHQDGPAVRHRRRVTGRSGRRAERRIELSVAQRDGRPDPVRARLIALTIG